MFLISDVCRHLSDCVVQIIVYFNGVYVYTFRKFFEIVTESKHIYPSFFGNVSLSNFSQVLEGRGNSCYF